MKSNMLFGLWLSVSLLSPAAWAKPSLHAPKDAKSVAAGKELFLTNCAACHGDTGKGDGPAGGALDPKPRDLMTGKFKLGDKDDAIFNTITKGSPGSAMTPWGDKLSSKQRWQLVAFVKSLHR